MLHRLVTPSQNHVAHAIEFANAAERAAYVFSPGDANKLALQVDTSELFIVSQSGTLIQAAGTSAGDVAAAISAHEQANNPHPQYQRAADVSAAIAAHVAAADPHTQYQTSAETQTQIDDSIASHTMASDPHPQYLTTSEIQYVHNQGTPQATWVVIHNMGRIPSVTIVDSAGTEVEGDVTHNTINQTTLSFTNPFAGKAYMN